jgi:hypothetical protein
MDVGKDSSIFLRKILDTITISRYMVSFNFSNNICIDVGGELIFTNIEGNILICDLSQNRINFSLSSIIEERIIQAGFIEENKFLIVFENTESLTFVADNKGESFVIHIDKDFEVF